jgi:hypothetical protein
MCNVLAQRRERRKEVVALAGSETADDTVTYLRTSYCIHKYIVIYIHSLQLGARSDPCGIFDTDYDDASPTEYLFLTVHPKSLPNT